MQSRELLLHQTCFLVVCKIILIYKTYQGMSEMDAEYFINHANMLTAKMDIIVCRTQKHSNQNHTQYRAKKPTSKFMFYCCLFWAQSCVVICCI